MNRIPHSHRKSNMETHLVNVLTDSKFLMTIRIPVKQKIVIYSTNEACKAYILPIDEKLRCITHNKPKLE